MRLVDDTLKHAEAELVTMAGSLAGSLARCRNAIDKANLTPLDAGRVVNAFNRLQLGLTEIAGELEETFTPDGAGPAQGAMLTTAFLQQQASGAAGLLGDLAVMLGQADDLTPIDAAFVAVDLSSLTDDIESLMGKLDDLTAPGPALAEEIPL